MQPSPRYHQSHASERAGGQAHPFKWPTEGRQRRKNVDDFKFKPATIIYRKNMCGKNLSFMHVVRSLLATPLIVTLAFLFR